MTSHGHAGPLHGAAAGPLHGAAAGPLRGAAAGPLRGAAAGPLRGAAAGPLHGAAVTRAESPSAAGSSSIAIRPMAGATVTSSPAPARMAARIATAPPKENPSSHGTAPGQRCLPHSITATASSVSPIPSA